MMAVPLTRSHSIVRDLVFFVVDRESEKGVLSRKIDEEGLRPCGEPTQATRTQATRRRRVSVAPTNPEIA